MLLEQMGNLYSYETIFKIKSEKDLDDLWSFCIFRLNLEKSEYTYDRFAQLYNLLSENKKLLSVESFIQITIKESSEEYFLFFETTIESIHKTIIYRLESLKFTYIFENNILIYSIPKRSKNFISALKAQPIECEILNFILPEDLEGMVDCLEKFQHSNYEKVYKVFNIDELNAYRTTLSYYSSYLRLYPQLEHIGNIIAELSIILSLYSDDCLRLKNDFRMLLQSFINNIVYWQEKLFLTGGESLSFLDQSFKADLSQIKMMLNLYDTTTEEIDEYSLDDIFDF